MESYMARVRIGLSDGQYSFRREQSTDDALRALWTMPSAIPFPTMNMMYNEGA